MTGSGDSAINYNQEPAHDGGDLPVDWNAGRDANGIYGHYTKFTYRDRHQDFWVYRGLHAGLPALQAGSYNTNTTAFVALTNATAIVGQPFSLFVYVSRQDEFLGLGCLDALTNGVTTNGLALQGTPLAVGTNTLRLVVWDRYDESRVTNTLTLRVLASGSITSQPRRLRHVRRHLRGQGSHPPGQPLRV